MCKNYFLALGKKVFCNYKKIQIKSFVSFCQLFISDDIFLTELITDIWKVIDIIKRMVEKYFFFFAKINRILIVNCFLLYLF